MYQPPKIVTIVDMNVTLGGNSAEELDCVPAYNCNNAAVFCQASIQYNFSGGSCTGTGKTPEVYCNTNCIFGNTITT